MSLVISRPANIPRPAPSKVPDSVPVLFPDPQPPLDPQPLFDPQPLLEAFASPDPHPPLEPHPEAVAAVAFAALWLRVLAVVAEAAG